MRIARRIRILTLSALLVVAVGLLVLGFDSVQTMAGNGYYDLTVELKSAGPEIVRASGQGFWNKESAPFHFRRPLDITNRIDVTFDDSSRDLLFGGSGKDWFWTTDVTEIQDFRLGEPRNAVT